jgi:hypothetical protein
MSIQPSTRVTREVQNTLERQEAQICTKARGHLVRVRRDSEAALHAVSVMAQMAVAFEHFNQVHPHSALKMRSPREFRQHRAAQQRLAQFEQTQHYE